MFVSVSIIWGLFAAIVACLPAQPNQYTIDVDDNFKATLLTWTVDTFANGVFGHKYLNTTTRFINPQFAEVIGPSEEYQEMRMQTIYSDQAIIAGALIGIEEDLYYPNGSFGFAAKDVDCLVCGNGEDPVEETKMKTVLNSVLDVGSKSVKSLLKFASAYKDDDTLSSVVSKSKYQFALADPQVSGCSMTYFLSGNVDGVERQFGIYKVIVDTLEGDKCYSMASSNDIHTSVRDAFWGMFDNHLMARSLTLGFDEAHSFEGHVNLAIAPFFTTVGVEFLEGQVRPSEIIPVRDEL